MSTSSMTSQHTVTSPSHIDENVPNTLLGRLYQEHIRLIMAKDIESLLEQYTEDAILISNFERAPRVYRGRDELRQHLQAILDIERIRVSVGFWGEIDDTILMITEGIEMTVEGQTSCMRFADSWVLRNGKIAIHFAGMVQYPDGSLA